MTTNAFVGLTAGLFAYLLVAAFGVFALGYLVGARRQTKIEAEGIARLTRNLDEARPSELSTVLNERPAREELTEAEKKVAELETELAYERERGVNNATCFDSERQALEAKINELTVRLK